MQPCIVSVSLNRATHYSVLLLFYLFVVSQEWRRVCMYAYIYIYTRTHILLECFGGNLVQHNVIKYPCVWKYLWDNVFDLS